MHKCFLSLCIPERELEAVENTIGGMEKDHTPTYITLQEQLGKNIHMFAEADNYLIKILQRNGIASVATLMPPNTTHYFPPASATATVAVCQCQDGLPTEQVTSSGCFRTLKMKSENFYGLG